MPVATSSPMPHPVQQTAYVIFNQWLLCGKENTDSNDKVVSELQSPRGEVDSFKREMQSFSKLVAHLVSVNKLTDVTILGAGKSSIDNSQLEFSLPTEEEFSQLKASLKSLKFRDSFVSLQLTFHHVQMTKLAGNLSFNPQSSLRRMLNYVWEP
ncbi:unnamed protein product [Trichobilharzia regenti]|nr:unnamed protein product [Trichobilharzia regenti]